MRVIQIVRVSGIATLGLAIATFLFGYCGWSFFYHFQLAIATMVCGLIHGSLVGWLRVRAWIHRRNRS